MKYRLRIHSIFSILLLTSIFIFFCFVYKYHMMFIEQLHIFQYNEHYLHSNIENIGGFSVLIGHFIAQFFYIECLGGLIVTLFSCVLLLLLQKILIDTKKNFLLYVPILFIPLFFLNVYINVAVPVSTLLAICFYYLYRFVSNKLPNRILQMLTIFSIPFLFFLLGGATFVAVSYILFANQIQNKSFKYSVVLALEIILLFVVGLYCSHFTVNQLFFLDIRDSEYTIITITYFILLSLYPWIFYLTKNVNCKYLNFTAILFIVALIVFSAYKVRLFDERLYKCDILLKQERWDDLLKVESTDPILTSYINLAMLNKGVISDCLFNYPQTEHVNEFWSSEYIPLNLMGELYYQLGLKTASRPYYFMANTQSVLGMTPYTLRRLIDVEYTRGNIRTAKKFLSVLKDSYRYSDIELPLTTTKNILPQDKQHEIPQDAFLGMNLVDNLFNAFRYGVVNKKILDMLLSKCILTANFDMFFVVLDQYNYPLGKAYQEFILMYAYIKNDTSLITKWKINKSVIENFYKYVQMNQSSFEPSELKEQIKKSFANTYWYYYQYISRNHEN